MGTEPPQGCCGACGIGDGGSLAVPQPHRRVEYCVWSRPSYARSRQLRSIWQTVRRPGMSIGTCARSADDKRRSKITSVPRLSRRSRSACSFRGLVCRVYDCLMPPSRLGVTMHETDSGSSEHSSQLLTLHCHHAALDTKPTSITWRCFVTIQSCLASPYRASFPKSAQPRVTSKSMICRDYSTGRRSQQVRSRESGEGRIMTRLGRRGVCLGQAAVVWQGDGRRCCT